MKNMRKITYKKKTHKTHLRFANKKTQLNFCLDIYFKSAIKK